MFLCAAVRLSNHIVMNVSTWKPREVKDMHVGKATTNTIFNHGNLQAHIVYVRTTLLPITNINLELHDPYNSSQSQRPQESH